MPEQLAGNTPGEAVVNYVTPEGQLLPPLVRAAMRGAVDGMVRGEGQVRVQTSQGNRFEVGPYHFELSGSGLRPGSVTAHEEGWITDNLSPQPLVLWTGSLPLFPSREAEELMTALIPDMPPRPDFEWLLAGVIGQIIADGLTGVELSNTRVTIELNGKHVGSNKPLFRLRLPPGVHTERGLRFIAGGPEIF